MIMLCVFNYRYNCRKCGDIHCNECTNAIWSFNSVEGKPINGKVCRKCNFDTRGDAAREKGDICQVRHHNIFLTL